MVRIVGFPDGNTNPNRISDAQIENLAKSDNIWLSSGVY
jgi:hypothetical protein